MYATASINVISYFLTVGLGLRSVRYGTQVTDLRKRCFCVKTAADNVQQNGTLYSSYLKHYFPSSGTSFDIDSDEYSEKGFNFDVYPYINIFMDMDVYSGTLMGTKPTYPSGMRECLKIAKGKRLEEDVLTLLSNGGKRDYLVRNNGDKVAVDSLAGKHLLIFCFKLPFSRTSCPAYACRSMISAYTQLVNDNEKNFEMVMVAKIAPLMATEEEVAAFNHFFQAFPCLAIPFWDTESRDFLCKSLGLTRPNKHFAALVVDPDQMVLQTEEDSRFYDFGASGFPYSDEKLDALYGEDEEIRCRLDYFHWLTCSDQAICKPGPVSLVELLGGYDLLLSRFGGGDEIRVSELSKKKCVVFYYCLNGYYMSKMERLRKECEAENREFEVVLVPIPFYSDATSYFKAVQAALESREISSWWVMPVSDDGEAATRRLWRLPGLRGGLPEEEQWMFVADGGNSGELDGRELMDRLSDWEVLYPYTRKSMLDQILCRIRSVTLDSLLGHDNQLIQLSSDSDSDSVSTVNVCELKGKNVVLYLGSYEAIIKGKPYPYKQVLWLYEQMQKDCPNSEVVFVPIDKEVPEPSLCPPMPFLVLPHPAAVVQESVIPQLFLDSIKQQGTFAFGDDGHVCSMYACDKVDGGNVSNLFSDTLFQEVSLSLKSYCLEYYY